MRCQLDMRRSDGLFTRATWGARCGQSARRVLRGGTGTSDLVARSVPTHQPVPLTGTSVIAKQETQRDRPRKFWCSTEAAVRGVEGRGNLFISLIENCGLQIAQASRLFADNLSELLSGAPRGLSD